MIVNFSASGTGSVVEPLSAVPMNDALQQAKASVAKAEADVLLKITQKVLLNLCFSPLVLSYMDINQWFLISMQMQEEIDNIESIFSVMVRLDVVGSITLNYKLSCTSTYFVFNYVFF